MRSLDWCCSGSFKKVGSNSRLQTDPPFRRFTPLAFNLTLLYSPPKSYFLVAAISEETNEYPGTPRLQGLDGDTAKVSHQTISVTV